jgi:hypothetical protein
MIVGEHDGSNITFRQIPWSSEGYNGRIEPITDSIWKMRATWSSTFVLYTQDAGRTWTEQPRDPQLFESTFGRNNTIYRVKDGWIEYWNDSSKNFIPKYAIEQYDEDHSVNQVADRYIMFTPNNGLREGDFSVFDIDSNKWHHITAIPHVALDNSFLHPKGLVHYDYRNTRLMFTEDFGANWTVLQQYTALSPQFIDFAVKDSLLAVTTRLGSERLSKTQVFRKKNSGWYEDKILSDEFLGEFWISNAPNAKIFIFNGSDTSYCFKKNEEGFEVKERMMTYKDKPVYPVVISEMNGSTYVLARQEAIDDFYSSDSASLYRLDAQGNLVLLEQVSSLLYRATILQNDRFIVSFPGYFLSVYDKINDELKRFEKPVRSTLTPFFSSEDEVTLQLSGKTFVHLKLADMTLDTFSPVEYFGNPEVMAFSVDDKDKWWYVDGKGIYKQDQDDEFRMIGSPMRVTAPPEFWGESTWLIGQNRLFQSTETFFANVEIRMEKQKVKVWPNPSNSLFKVLLPQSHTELISYRILDQFGRLVTTEQNVTHEKNSGVKIDLSQMTSGIYYVVIENLELEPIKVVKF